MNDINVLVLSAQQWDFNDDNGQNRTGVSVYVSHLDGPQPERIIGRKPVKYTLPLDQFHIFQGQKLPARAIMQTSFDFERQKLVPTSFLDFESIS